MSEDTTSHDIPDIPAGQIRSRPVLDSVELDGAHVGVLRWHRRVGVIVPPAWYARAVAALSRETAAQGGDDSS